jgi:hypothetical protein
MDIWSECCKSIQKCPSNEESFHRIFENLAAKLTEEDLQLAAMVARQIWLRRNTVVFGGELISSSTVIRQATD